MQPVLIYRDPGVSQDDMDNLRLGEAFENPKHWEETVRRAHSEARSDPVFARMLESVYLDEDRSEAFERFIRSDVPEAMVEFMARFGITTESEICDYGCGRGHLANALLRSGFSRVTAMDPNAEEYSGTGYLYSCPRPDSRPGEYAAPQ